MIKMNKNKEPLTRREHLKEAIFGTPKKDLELKPAKTLVLGAVEQSYGIYQIPSFRDQVTTFWDDPILKESIIMFAEQVIATGFYLTGNPKYIKKLPINGKVDEEGKQKEYTALEIIQEWCDLNNIDVKLLDIPVELKAFGNSFWRISEDGFVKIPIEAVWHSLRVAPDIPLQDEYHLQLQPIYGGKVIKWGQFVHFRTGLLRLRFLEIQVFCIVQS